MKLKLLELLLENNYYYLMEFVDIIEDMLRQVQQRIGWLAEKKVSSTDYILTFFFYNFLLPNFSVKV